MIEILELDSTFTILIIAKTGNGRQCDEQNKIMSIQLKNDLKTTTISLTPKYFCHKTAIYKIQTAELSLLHQIPWACYISCPRDYRYCSRIPRSPNISRDFQRFFPELIYTSFQVITQIFSNSISRGQSLENIVFQRF